MNFLKLLQDNWFTLLQSLGIVGSLFFTGLSFRIDAKVRRVANGFELTKQHREIWTHLYSRPDLKRVLDPSVNLQEMPVTEEEELFVNFLILHLANAHRAIKSGLFVSPQELQADMRTFFQLPIPREVWFRARKFQGHDFVSFVEGAWQGQRS